MIDFPTSMIGQPCVILGEEKIPAGVFDEDGNCVIKVPWSLQLTRPDGVADIKVRQAPHE